jgi:nucleoid-associated protein YgaU
MADFNQMGGLPTGYADLLNAARQQLVKLPDGTYVQAPQFGGSTNIDELYKGIYPPALSAPPLVSRSVNTVPIDPTTGSPVGFTAPTMAATRTEQTGLRPAITQGTQPAGTATLPPGARPASVDRAFAQMQVPQVPQPGMFGRGLGSTVADPFGTRVANQDQSRLPANDGGEAGFLSTFYPSASPSAVTAIDNAAPVPMPRVRPIPPAMTPLTALTGGLVPTGETLPGGTNFDGSPVKILAPPAVPGPRNAGNYTIKSGDTLGALAKRFGTTVNQLANANGISNPNKIRAGATLNLGYLAPPVPRMPPAALGRVPQQQSRPRETFDQIWAEARG